jgi:hypothetical protein
VRCGLGLKHQRQRKHQHQRGLDGSSKLLLLTVLLSLVACRGYACWHRQEQAIRAERQESGCRTSDGG